MVKKVFTTNCMDKSLSEKKQENKVLGNTGEQIAVQFLQSHGYLILETNFRWGQAEADIVCKKGGELIFAEVKTRSSSKFGEPEMAVTKVKQQQYKRLAEGYLEKNRVTNMDIRFDIISIVMKQPEPEIFHIQDAFFPFN